MKRKMNPAEKLSKLVFDLVKEGKIKTEEIRTDKDYERFINED